jgi:hypothetical protein
MTAQYLPLYEQMQYDLPIWIHPARGGHPDYA